VAVALAARRAAPRVSLGSFLGASFGLDLLWPVLLVTGEEGVVIDPRNTPRSASRSDRLRLRAIPSNVTRVR